MSLRFPLRKCWMKRGQQLKLPAPPDFRHYVHLIGAYNWRTDEVTACSVERKNTQSFFTFLEQLLLDRYPSHPIVLVMDNASYHHSAPIQALLGLLQHRVHVLFLPPRCPDLNPIERYWRHLKDLACANTLFQTLESLTLSVKQVLDAQLDPDHDLHFSFSKHFQ